MEDTDINTDTLPISLVPPVAMGTLVDGKGGRSIDQNVALMSSFMVALAQQTTTISTQTAALVRGLTAAGERLQSVEDKTDALSKDMARAEQEIQQRLDGIVSPAMHHLRDEPNLARLIAFLANFGMVTRAGFMCFAPIEIGGSLYAAVCLPLLKQYFQMVYPDIVQQYFGQAFQAEAHQLLNKLGTRSLTMEQIQAVVACLPMRPYKRGGSSAAMRAFALIKVDTLIALSRELSKSPYAGLLPDRELDLQEHLRLRDAPARGSMISKAAFVAPLNPKVAAKVGFLVEVQREAMVPTEEEEEVVVCVGPAQLRTFFFAFYRANPTGARERTDAEVADLEAKWPFHFVMDQVDLEVPVRPRQEIYDTEFAPKEEEGETASQEGETASRPTTRSSAAPKPKRRRRRY